MAEEPAGAEPQVDKPHDTDVPTLSKNQIKKQARRLAKKEAHQKKKAAKKELKAAAQEQKNEERKQQLAALTEEEKQERILNQKRRKREREEEKEQRAKKLNQAADNAPKIVIDLDFWDKMKEGEQISLVSQLGFCIGVNRKADAPCSLHYTSFCGGVLEQANKQFPHNSNWSVEKHKAAWDTAFAGKKQSLVYLTADASEQIDTLEKDCMYIVGGIVDRNRYPQLCLKKAEELGVRTAKLPIGEHLKLTGSKVLTVNQTVGILVKYWSCRDWQEAVTAVVPTRKAD